MELVISWNLQFNTVLMLCNEIFMGCIMVKANVMPIFGGDRTLFSEVVSISHLLIYIFSTYLLKILLSILFFNVEEDWWIFGILGILGFHFRKSYYAEQCAAIMTSAYTQHTDLFYRGYYKDLVSFSVTLSQVYRKVSHKNYWKQTNFN